MKENVRKITELNGLAYACRAGEACIMLIQMGYF